MSQNNPKNKPESIDDLIDSLAREVAMRKAVYPKRIADKKMSTDKANYETLCTIKTLRIMKLLKENKVNLDWVIKNVKDEV